MTRRCKLRADFTDAVTEVLLTRGLPEDIIQLILGTRDYAADVIRRMALGMPSGARNIRMSIRWFVMGMGLPEPFVVRGRGWRWVDPTDDNMTALEELVILTRWQMTGRHVPPYIPARAVPLTTETNIAVARDGSMKFASVLLAHSTPGTHMHFLVFSLAD